jgi:hypothetical protein
MMKTWADTKCSSQSPQQSAFSSQPRVEDEAAFLRAESFATTGLARLRKKSKG